MPLLRPLEAVSRRIAKRQVENERKDRVVDADRKHFGGDRRRDLNRNAKQVAWRDVNAAAKRDGWASVVLAKVERDLGTGVAHADHQDGPTGKLTGAHIVGAVQDLALECRHPRHIRHHRFRIEAGRDHDTRSVDCTGCTLNRPAAAGPSNRANGLAEARLEFKSLRVIFQILGDQVPRHIARIAGGERKVRQRRQLLDGVQVQPLVMPSP